MSRSKFWIAAFAAVAVTQVAAGQPAWSASQDLKIKELGATGEDLSDPMPADDHIIAALSYEITETTQLCGGPMGRTSMRITVHADGAYRAVETSSRLDCSKSGPVRKAAYAKHGGKLSVTDLAKFWARVSEITEQSRELAADKSSSLSVAGAYRARILRAEDLRGVLHERSLKEFVLTGQAAEASARFMQSFIFEGKMD